MQKKSQDETKAVINRLIATTALGSVVGPAVMTAKRMITDEDINPSDILLSAAKGGILGAGVGAIITIPQLVSTLEKQKALYTPEILQEIAPKSGRSFIT